jgi:hypothetical protein
MMPMANRLHKALDSATFGYTEEDLERDIIEIENISTEETTVPTEAKDIKTKFAEGSKKTIDSLSGFFSKKKESSAAKQNEDVLDTLKKLSKLKDSGVITQEEFESKKIELLAKL